MKKTGGFTLLEVLVFIIIMGLLATTIMISLTNMGQKSPEARQQMTASFIAQQCMEYLLGQRRVIGYSTITCPSSTTPNFCTVPSGYTLSTSIACTTLNGDANYKTITLTVSGNGDATITSLVGDY